MMKQALQTVLLLTSVAVVIPYTTSFLCNILYGWPQTKNKYRRALNPKKVYKMNYSILQKLYITLKYAPAYFKWKRFYKKLDPFTVRKNIPYGRNYCTLDLYNPRPESGDLTIPIVVFVYGGAWGSGDKNMYGPLCVEIANRLKAVVCCPNLSIYPKGYVDDMIQDVVDCVAWICDNPHIHGANKNNIVLIGHSSGAHLCMMSVLELLNIEIPGEPQQSRIRFDESYFNNKPRSDTLDDSSGSSASFCVVNDNADKPPTVASVATETRGTLPSLTESTVGTSISASMMEVIKSEITDQSNEGNEDKGDNSDKHSSGDGEDIKKDEKKDESDVKPAVHEVENRDDVARPKELETHATLTDLSKSIKVVIGLAGVYNISDHFEHESIRGVEDISKMARAMYGQEYFDRFSPSVLCRTLSPGVSAPSILLLHGTEDYVVPVTSTTKLCEGLQENMMDVTVRIIPGCDHYEICLDLMNPKYKFYKPMMELLLEVTNKVLNRNVEGWS